MVDRGRMGKVSEGGRSSASGMNEVSLSGSQLLVESNIGVTEDTEYVAEEAST